MPAPRSIPALDHPRPKTVDRVRPMRAARDGSTETSPMRNPIDLPCRCLGWSRSTCG